jgi:hypothetical protein
MSNKYTDASAKDEKQRKMFRKMSPETQQRLKTDYENLLAGDKTPYLKPAWEHALKLLTEVMAETKSDTVIQPDLFG